MDLYESSQQNGGRKPYVAIAAMVNYLKDVCPWISRNTINFAYNKYLASKENTLDVEKLGDLPVPRSQGGQTTGATKEAKAELKNRIRLCLDGCASELHERKNVVKRDGKYFKKGAWKKS